MASVIYNDIDPFACRWLSALIDAGELPAGDVLECSIVDVTPSMLDGVDQAHFFAGIGGWPYAARLAEWPATRPIWSASLPCQPFSVAQSNSKGVADERHLWSDFLRLVAKCRPPTIVGEQVASKDGRAWLVGVFADLERLGYAVAAADLPAASVGAPHVRQRLFWVADARGERLEEPRSQNTLRIGAFANTWNARERWWVNGRRRIPAKSELFPVADGVPGRVGKLRGYGNAIVPQVAAEFLSAFLET